MNTEKPDENIEQAKHETFSAEDKVLKTKERNKRHHRIQKERANDAGDVEAPPSLKRRITPASNEQEKLPKRVQFASTTNRRLGFYDFQTSPQKRVEKDSKCYRNWIEST